MLHCQNVTELSVTVYCCFAAQMTWKTVCVVFHSITLYSTLYVINETFCCCHSFKPDMLQLNLVCCGDKSIYIFGEILFVLQSEFRIPFLSLI